VRPQTIAIHRQAPPAPDGGWWVRGRITERAYLGEYWEYVVNPPDCALRLRVSTPPTTVYDIAETVWLEIDPTRVARIPAPEETRP
jgi:iron(III) transport system ATP-binding protein